LGISEREFKVKCPNILVRKNLFSDRTRLAYLHYKMIFLEIIAKIQQDFPVFSKLRRF
jgi:hypothetical protein